MIGCNRPRFRGERVPAGARHAAYVLLAVMLLLLVSMALPAGATLWAQEQAPPGIAPNPPVPATEPPNVPSAPQFTRPASAPSVLPVEPQMQQQLVTSQFRPAPVPRFQFTIAADTPLKDLLPVAPSAKTTGAAVHDRGLAGVPEVDFQAPLPKGLATAEAKKQTAHMIAKVNHVNAKQTDGFMDALRGARPDLTGLPFMMGDDCRIKGDRSRELTRAVATVRNALRGRAVAGGTVVFATPAGPPPPPLPPSSGMPVQQPVPPPPTPAVPPREASDVQTGIVADVTFSGVIVADRGPASNFWEQYASACSQEDKRVSGVDRAKHENVLIARVGALMQVLGPESPELRVGLVKYLAAVSHAEATRALARLAVFSEEDEVRQAAVAALTVRRERDYSDVLLSSLRYPWPAVAARGADALAKLERADLVPQLVELLDEADPRAPVAKTSNGRRVREARELVRVNHHRNCLLCHAPGNTAGVSPETLTAVVPVPSDPLPSSSDGYQTKSPDLSVRIDVTYLRPDFSLMQAVADANPWPEMQRFDFLVRTRVLTEDEAAARERSVAIEPGRPTPYHRAILAALRELTGRDAAPTADAWRKLLNLPAAARQAVRAP